MRRDESDRADPIPPFVLSTEASGVPWDHVYGCGTFPAVSEALGQGSLGVEGDLAG
jgi:hypothetical protein